MSAELAFDLLLWLVVGVLAVTVLALARQVGVLSQRVAPAGALTPTAGPKIGELTEEIAAQDLDGKPLRLGGASSAENTLLLFISPTCPVCKSLLPAAKSLAATERLRLIFASDGFSQTRHRDFASEVGLVSYPYVLSEALGMRYGVSRLPFAVLIGADGVLRGRGLVNTREHLESLLESWRTGVATLQDYVRDFAPAELKEAP
jgi:methylamine dehydrogenase accessory protein MauD